MNVSPPGNYFLFEGGAPIAHGGFEIGRVGVSLNLGKDTPLSAPIITRYRDRNSNLRTQLERIIRKSDLKPWPKLFQNLRATRETELAED